MTNTGLLLVRTPAHPRFTRKGNKKNKPSGENFPTRRTFAGWNNPVLKICILMVMNGCSGIRLATGKSWSRR
jgi:hypothetical protein